MSVYELQPVERFVGRRRAIHRAAGAYGWPVPGAVELALDELRSARESEAPGLARLVL